MGVKCANDYEYYCFNWMGCSGCALCVYRVVERINMGGLTMGEFFILAGIVCILVVVLFVKLVDELDDDENEMYYED